MHVARRILVTVVALGTLVSFGPAALAGGVVDNRVRNGGFERPEITDPFVQATGTDIPRWTITGCIDLVSEPTFRAARGDQSVDLNGSVGGGTACAPNARGAISQSIDTDPNQDYLLRFFLAGNPGCTESAAAKVKVVEVYWDGALVATFRYDTTGQTAANINWQLRALELRAKTGDTVLEFKSANGGNCGPMIDAVRVTEA
jgi:Protein of unknown function (DUF642)